MQIQQVRAAIECEEISSPRGCVLFREGLTAALRAAVDNSGGLRLTRMPSPQETVLQKPVENQHGNVPKTGKQWVSHVGGRMEGPLSGIQGDLEEIVVFFHRRQPYLAARRLGGGAII